MSENFVPPSRGKDGFNCPYCEAFAHQVWKDVYISSGGIQKKIDSFELARCNRCGHYTIWEDAEMVHPDNLTAPQPAEEMPEPVKEDFEEARKVLQKSPRSAAALLRLAIEKLVNELEEEGNTLNSKIGNLIEKNKIDERIQKSLDSVRVIGNESVHPGELDIKDDRDTAEKLFELVNIIVRTTIQDEKLIREMYEDLPDKKKDGIENRDN
ncbi:MAG: DUF4145 domain-containing protein [Candidatus Nanohaloarchaea archaeon]